MTAEPAAVLSALAERGLSLGVAESLTGGLLAAAVVSVPGASATFRGGVVTYATELKAALLGVDVALLERRGAVDPEVALQMAHGARRVLGSDVGLATTGVAGPEPQDGQPVGRVYVAAVADLGGTAPAERVEELSLEGDRGAIRAAAVTAALGLVRVLLGGPSRDR